VGQTLRAVCVRNIIYRLLSDRSVVLSKDLERPPFFSRHNARDLELIPFAAFGYVVGFVGRDKVRDFFCGDIFHHVKAAVIGKVCVWNQFTFIFLFFPPSCVRF